MQAVARIHRLTQTRATQVIRFVVDDTVEAALHRLTSAKAAKMDMASSSSAARRDPPLTVADVALLLFDSQAVCVE